MYGFLIKNNSRQTELLMKEKISKEGIKIGTYVIVAGIAYQPLNLAMAKELP